MELTPIWFDQAECKGQTELMYPDDRVDSAIAIAKSICEGCVVIEQCRDYALKHKEHDGVWAGMTPVERRSYSRKLHRNAARKV